MRERVTTTKNGFRVEDVTFKNARRQSAIESELNNEEDIMDSDISVPVSLTPEQVKAFYRDKIALVSDSNEKRLYSQTIMWIDELLKANKKINALEEKLNALTVEEAPEDLEDDTK